MIFVDTAYLLALSQPADALHRRARTWADAIAERLLTTEHVLWETVNALSKPPDRAKAHLLLAHVRSTAGWEVVNATTELFEAGMQLHRERRDKSWSLTDCVSFVVMERRGITRALTSDHHFKQAGHEALLERDPP